MKKIILALAVLTISLSFMGCSAKETKIDGDIGVEPGMIAPDFTLLDKDDKEVSLYDFQGKVTFINFWATTCPYCVDEMPDLEEFYNNHKDDGDFALLGVNMHKTWEKKSKEDIVDWVEDLGISFPVVFDVEGDQAQQWRAHNLPMTFIVDKDGKSLGAIMGMTNLNALEQTLEEVREGK